MSKAKKEKAVEVTENKFLTMKVMDESEYATTMEAYVKQATSTQEQAVILSHHALLHYHRTGNADYMTALYKKSPSAIRRGAIKNWFQGHAPVKWDGKKETFVKDREENALPTYPAPDKRELAENAETIERVNRLIQAAFNTPFYEYSQDLEDMLDFVPEKLVYNRLKSLLQTLEKDMEKSGKVLPADMQDDIARLRTMKDEYEVKAANAA